MPSLRSSALLLAYPVVWAFSTASFWLAGSSSDALGFTLLHLYFLHPVAILAVSFAAAFRVTSLRRLTVIPFALALGYILCDFLTFRLANMISFSQWTSPGMLKKFEETHLLACAVTYRYNLAKPAGKSYAL